MTTSTCPNRDIEICRDRGSIVALRERKLGAVMSISDNFEGPVCRQCRLPGEVDGVGLVC
jgi:hypothetical protein